MTVQKREKEYFQEGFLKPTWFFLPITARKRLYLLPNFNLYMPIDMNYVSVAEYAKAQGLAERTVRNYCVQGKILGAKLIGKT